MLCCWSTPWQPPQKNSSLLHHDRCWLNPKPALSSMTEFLAWLCTCSCFICYSLMWGWHKVQWENILTNMKWRSQDPRIARTLNSGMRGLEGNAKGNKDLFPALKYSEQNQMNELYSPPWKAKIFEMYLLCSKYFVYKMNYFSSSSSFLWKQICHCPGCSGRQKTWAGIKTTLLYWLLRDPQNMMWPLSYIWLMPKLPLKLTCPVGLTWIYLTKVSDYFKY